MKLEIERFEDLKEIIYLLFFPSNSLSLRASKFKYEMQSLYYKTMTESEYIPSYLVGLYVKLFLGYGWY